jgi:hypothetical protein
MIITDLKIGQEIIPKMCVMGKALHHTVWGKFKILHTIT